MKKIIHIQTMIFEEELSELKKKTGKEQTQDALSDAVHYYLKNVK